jgi:hypothetical protein
VEVEFYLLSSGVVEIARASSIASEFEKMWGCEFHFNERGEVPVLKTILAHSEKTRYLLQLSKGADWQGEEPENVYRDVRSATCTCRSIRSFSWATAPATCRPSA